MSAFHTNSMIISDFRIRLSVETTSISLADKFLSFIHDRRHFWSVTIWSYLLLNDFQLSLPYFRDGGAGFSRKKFASHHNPCCSNRQGHGLQLYCSLTLSIKTIRWPKMPSNRSKIVFAFGVILCPHSKYHHHLSVISDLCDKVFGRYNEFQELA